MSQDTAYQEALQKAERFFARSNFPLAKKEFEKALRLQPSGELQEKLRTCSREIDLQKRKEIIKRGRSREKRGRYHEALQCYEQALAQGEEDWLVKKISLLKEKLLLSKVSSQIEQAEASGDIEATLAAYDQALQVSATPELVAKQATSLVRAGRYQEAIGGFTNHPPTGDTARYYFGYAYAKTGQYVKALEQWNAIEDVKDTQLWQHYEALLPFVCHELSTGADPHGYLQFKAANGDIANIKWTVRAVFFKGEKKPKLVDYGHWELVSGTWYFANRTGVGTLTIKPTSKTDRLFTLAGEIGPQP